MSGRTRAKHHARLMFSRWLMRHMKNTLGFDASSSSSANGPGTSLGLYLQVGLGNWAPQLASHRQYHPHWVRRYFGILLMREIVNQWQCALKARITCGG